MKRTEIKKNLIKLQAMCAKHRYELPEGRFPIIEDKKQHYRMLCNKYLEVMV